MYTFWSSEFCVKYKMMEMYEKWLLYIEMKAWKFNSTFQRFFFNLSNFYPYFFFKLDLL